MIEFGPEIIVDRERPGWLTDDPVAADLRIRGVWQFTYDERETSPLVWAWGAIDAIKLPITHPHYTKDTAMTDEEIIAKGFTPWYGGHKAPADWDGRKVLYRDGLFSTNCARKGTSWVNNNQTSDIIGYHPKEPTKPTRIVIPDGPAPEWAEKRADELWASVEGKSGNSVLTFAAHLIAMLEQPPVDPVLMKAREICEAAKVADSDIVTADFITGEYDNQFCMRVAIAALNAGQEMGKGEV